MKKTLLISTIGGQVGLGLLKLLEPFRDRVRVVGLNSVAEVSLNFLCDAVYLVPPTADRAAWSDRMRAIIAAESPDAVVPGRDADLLPLAALKGEAAHAAIVFFSPGPRTAAIVTAKDATAIFAAAHGLPFVETAWEPAAVEALLARYGFPLVVKPRGASGGAGVRALTRRSEVEAWLARGGVVFQPFIAPEPLGEDSVDPALGIPLGFHAPWRRYLNPTVTVSPSGVVTYRGCSYLEPRGSGSRSFLAEDPAIERLTLAYGQALAAEDFVGSCMLQGRRDRDGTYLPFEICGRISGGVYSRSLIGLEEIGDVLDFLVPDRPPVRSAPEAIVHRIPDWHIFAAADVERLRQEGVWRKV